MDVAVKICGLTRPEDAAAAAAAGASYVGVVFAGGPRQVSAAHAREILDAAGPRVLRAGVFGAVAPAEILDVALDARLDVVQMHADPSVQDVLAVRDAFGGKCWAAVRPPGDRLPDDAADLFAVADAVVLDARAPGALGGSGVPLPWESLSTQIELVRHSTSLVLAGGLTPANVARAIRLLRPDVADVSSGVESAPGVKDHSRIHAFVEAVRSATEDAR